MRKRAENVGRGYCLGCFHGETVNLQAGKPSLLLEQKDTTEVGITAINEVGDDVHRADWLWLAIDAEVDACATARAARRENL